MRSLVITFLLVFAAGLIPPAAPASQNMPQVVTVEVNGLVCDFCARSIEKMFGKREEVASLKVNLDERRVTIGLKPGKALDDASIRQIITDAGYNVVSISRAH